MIKHFDHVTIVVEELDESIKFFELIGFVMDKSMEISGGRFTDYMNMESIDANHVTLVPDIPAFSRLAGQAPQPLNL